MSPHFCKVGRVRPSLGDVLGLKELENKYLSFIEEAYNIMQTDAGMSDVLYHEASKLKKQILNLNQEENNLTV
jgi:hypothetical protein